jgi:hypothetical protein
VLGKIPLCRFDFLAVEDSTFNGIPRGQLCVEESFRARFGLTRHAVGPILTTAHVADDPSRAVRRGERRADRVPRFVFAPRGLVNHNAVNVLGKQRVGVIGGLEPDAPAADEFDPQFRLVVLPRDAVGVRAGQHALEPVERDFRLREDRRNPPVIPTRLSLVPRLDVEPDETTGGLSDLG